MSKNRKVPSKATGDKSPGPLLLIGVGIVIILVVVIWQLSRLPATTVAQSSSNFDIPFPEMTRISLSEAKKAYDEGGALIVDVRDSGSYASEHITGSVNIPVSEIETRFNELPKDRWILTVCT